MGSLINLRTSLQSILALVGVAFALNLAWEMVQTRFFADMAGLPLWEASGRCLLATVGDVAITVAAYCVIAAWARQMSWMHKAETRFAVAFWIAALGISIVIERHAVAAGRWHYVPEMPLVPGIGIGLAPAAQWVLLPSLTLALARRFAAWARHGS